MDDPQLNPRREFRGVWIRASLWRRKDLSWFEKCLLAEIDSLGEQCFASNGYLAAMMGTTPGNIANGISRLRTAGLIVDLAFDGRVRRLTVDASVASDPGVNTPVAGLKQHSQKSEGGLHPGVNIDTRGEQHDPSDHDLANQGGGQVKAEAEQLNLRSSQIQKAPTIAERVRDQWNATVRDLPKVESMTAERKAAVGRILKDRKWNLAVTQRAFQAVQDSDFLCGRLNGANWKADFSWVMQEANFIRILEGSFTNKNSKRLLTEADHAKGF
jgi:hypothetical protein